MRIGTSHSVRRRLVACLIFLASLSAAFSASAQTTTASSRGFHAFAAVSQNLRFPGSIRVGWGDWELGQITPFAPYGFNKVFDINSRSYAALGFIVSRSVGLYGGIGFKYSLWGFGVRGELTTTYDAKGFTQGLGLLGVTYGF